MKQREECHGINATNLRVRWGRRNMTGSIFCACSEAPLTSRSVTVMMRVLALISTSPKNCRPALGGRLIVLSPGL